MDKKLLDYIWENIEELKDLFPSKVYKILSKFKTNEDREGFEDTLEYILNIDEALFLKIEKYFKNIKNSEDINSMSIDKIIEVLEITSFDNFVNKQKYIDRAEYWIGNYKNKKDIKYLNLLNNLASLYERIGEYKKAEPLYIKALEISKKVFGEEDTSIATIYGNLARIYESMGEYKKAEPLYIKALEIGEKLYEEEHPDIATVYGNLAKLYESMGEYKKAEPLYIKALEIREKLYEEEHPDIATIYDNLARLYESMGEYKKAEPLYIKALEIREKLYEEEHPDIAVSYDNLANLYEIQDNNSKAEFLYKKALGIRERVFGEKHLYTAISYNNLAGFYWGINSYKLAEHLFKKVLRIKEEILGEGNLDTAISYDNLAIFYFSIIEYKKAEQLYLKTLEIREKLLGEEHPETAITYNNLAGLYESMGENKKAEHLYIKALKTSEKALGEKHPNTLNIFSNFNNFRETQNKLFFLNSKNSNLEFRVDRVEVKNFKGYKNTFSLEFSENINIIIGENATGKTTLLQALVFGLAKKNFIDIRGLDYSRYITKGESKAEVRIIYNRDREKIVKIKTDEIEIDNVYFTPFVLAYNANLFTKYSINPDKVVKNILDETIHKDTVSSIFKDYIDEFWNPLSILKELNRSKHKKAKEKLNIFIETINRFLDGFELVREDEDYFFKKEGTDIQLELEDLSEGYRSNVLLISDMLIKILGVGCTPKSIDGIVLIDEFDKHLHPRWQSRLVNQLKESFPKIQFIMTTHNPMSILDREADEIIILEDIDGKIVAKKRRGTKSVDVSIVLLEYFGVEATVGNEMREKINNFNRLKLKKDLTKDEKKELEELEKFLGSTIASNFIYDRKYLKFLEFLRDHKDIDFDKYEKITDEEMNQLLEDFGDFFDD